MYLRLVLSIKDAVRTLSAELSDTSKTAYEEMVAGLGQEILSEISQAALQKSYDIYRREEQCKTNEYRTREKQASEFLNQQERERRKPKSDDLLGMAAGWMNDRVKDAQDFAEDLNNSDQDRKRAADHSSEPLIQEMNRKLPEALSQRMDKREQLSAEFWVKQAGDGKQALRIAGSGNRIGRTAVRERSLGDLKLVFGGVYDYKI